MREVVEGRGWLTVALLSTFAGAPFVWAASGAGGWRPTGDIAAIALRASDTFSRHIPLVGMPSTAGGDLHHPGPLQFWTTGVLELAIPGAGATLWATLLVNIASIVAVVAIGWRIGEHLGASLAAGGCILLAWSLEAPQLLSPLNPFAALFPAAAAIACAVALMVDRSGGWPLPVGLVAASYAAQAHLVFAALLVVGLGPVLVVLVLEVARGRAPRLSLVAFVLVLVVWAGPLVDAGIHAGGNLIEVVDLADGGEEALGAERAVRILGGGLAPVPLFLDRSATGATIFGGISVLAATFAATGVAIAIALPALRRREPVRTHLGWMAVTLLAATWVIVARFPSSAFNSFAFHNYLPLLLATLLTWGLGVTFLIGLGRSRMPQAARTYVPGTVACFVVVGLVSAAAVVTRGDAEAFPTEVAYVRALGPQLSDALPADQRHLLQMSDDLRLFGVDAGLVAAAERNGRTLLVPPGSSETFGDHRTARAVDGYELRSQFERPSARTQVLASFQPDPDLVAEWEQLVAAIADDIAADPGLVGPHADDLRTEDERRRFVRQVLPGLASGGLLEGPYADSEQVGRLVDLARSPIKPLYIVRVS